MPTWVTCPACHLKHTARADGTCPRCKTNLAAAAPAPPPPPGPPQAIGSAGPAAAEAPPPMPPPAATPIVPGGPPAVPALPRPAYSGVAAASAPDLVYPHEASLFPIMLSLSLLFWVALLVGTFGMVLIYVPFVALMYLFTQSALIAYVKGTAVRITPRQFPDLHARVTACAERLGIAKVPDCYLLNGQGAFNAFATRFLGRNFVILLSNVVDALEDRPGAIDFYVGHELAHVARKHLQWRPVLLPAGILPLVGAAYHRACESTGDRHGAACCAATDDAVAAITALAAGEKRWKTLDAAEYAAQAGESGGFWMSFHELVSDYPWLVKRVARVVAFREGGQPDLPARSPLAYFFALLVPRGMGGGAGGLASLLVVVALIGIVAAIAIPSLLRARVSANEAAAAADVRAVFAGESAYARQWGRAATLACLAGEPGCRPEAYPPSISAAVASSEFRNGYRFVLALDAGQPAAFTYTAVPIRPGQTGVRSFCADDTGVHTSDGEAFLAHPPAMTCATE